MKRPLIIAGLSLITMLAGLSAVGRYQIEARLTPPAEPLPAAVAQPTQPPSAGPHIGSGRLGGPQTPAPYAVGWPVPYEQRNYKCELGCRVQRSYALLAANAAVWFAASAVFWWLVLALAGALTARKRPVQTDAGPGPK